MKKKIKEAASTEIVVASIESQAAPLVKKLKRITAVTKDNFAEAGIQLKALVAVKKEGLRQQAELLSSTKRTEKLIRSLFKPALDRLTATENEYRELILKYVKSSTQKQIQIVNDYGSNKIKKISTYNDKLADATVDKVKGGVSLKKVKKLFIVDENKIPRSFMVPDEVAIRQAFIDGKKVAGCEFKEVDSLSV